MIVEFQQTLDRVPHQRLTASVGGPHTEWETGVGLIKHWVAGNNKNVPGGRGKVYRTLHGLATDAKFLCYFKTSEGKPLCVF